MSMFDNGSRAEATENRMLEKWCRSAFAAGFRRSDNPPPPQGRIDAAFEEWWNSSELTK